LLSFVASIRNAIELIIADPKFESLGSDLNRELQNAYFSTGLSARILDLLEICALLRISPTQGLLELSRALDGEGPSHGGARFLRDGKARSAWDKAVGIWTARHKEGTRISDSEPAKLVATSRSTLRDWMKRPEWARDIKNQSDALRNVSRQIYADLQRKPKP
jgi:hypothetical protein